MPKGRQTDNEQCKTKPEIISRDTKWDLNHIKCKRRLEMSGGWPTCKGLLGNCSAYFGVEGWAQGWSQNGSGELPSLKILACGCRIGIFLLYLEKISTHLFKTWTWRSSWFLLLFSTHWICQQTPSYSYFQNTSWLHLRCYHPETKPYHASLALPIDRAS